VFERSLDDGSASVRDVLQAETSLVRGDYAEVLAFLRRTIRVDRSFADFVAAARARGMTVTVVSSGIERLVRDRLDEIGVGEGEIAIVGNDVEPDPSGWRIIFRDDSPNGTDKAALVRAARDAGKRTAFIGDGRSDYEVSVETDERFAKRGGPLERFLAERDVEYETFSTFADVTERLASR